MLNAAGARKTEGVVLQREGDSVLVQFSFENKTYKQRDEVDPDVANPGPGDKVAVLVFHGYHHNVVSMLESSHEKLVRRDLWFVGAGVISVIVGYWLLPRSDKDQESTQKA